ncbi:DNA mismatch repair protein MutL, partial [bacterium]|nr:DNA mismatch repair protein MutL [bacterium]
PQFSPAIWRNALPSSEDAAVDSDAGPLFDTTISGDSLESDPDASAIENSAAPRLSGEIPILRLVGQVGATYLVAEGPDGLYLIDQHAAHERVLFERLMSKSATIPIQQLLQPVTVTLAPDAARLLSSSLEILN